MTTKLAVRYRRPAHINLELTIRAELVADDGRRIDVEADLLDGEQILANARGTWAHVPLEHFLQTPEGRAAGEAWRERLQGAP